MKKTELKTDLLINLAALLKPYGFTLIRRMDWFVRKGKTSLIYRLDFYGGYDRDKGYIVSPSLAIRIDEIEDIYHKVSGFEPQFQKDTPTIWPTIKDLQRAKDGYEYELDSVEDKTPVVEKLFSIFKDIGLPFLEKNSSIAAIDKLLNSNPENENSIFDTPVPRFYRGVIVAKLAKRENYEQIVETYRKYLSQVNGYHLDNYEKLIKILNSNY